MWYRDFADRLESWHSVRTAAKSMPLQNALVEINTWWHNAPWSAHYLHWDDAATWPDPWQLLSDNIFCELARGLGIMYTISMMNHPEITSAELVLTEEGYNLVVVNKELYILNWDREDIVNTPHNYKVKQSLSVDQLKKQYKI